jgi:hypothetical protein
MKYGTTGDQTAANLMTSTERSLANNNPQANKNQALHNPVMVLH